LTDDFKESLLTTDFKESLLAELEELLKLSGVVQLKRNRKKKEKANKDLEETIKTSRDKNIPFTFVVA
jgi:ElaB/YqjD/DUF883 family membrane-anchored ribosome-binding protein